MKNKYTPVLLFVIKMVLGITFVYSSYHKIEDPAGFARVLYGYAVFPDISINLLAILIPFVELTAGFCLIFGLYSRSALLIINCLLTAFIVLISFNLLRGHQFDCGCFSSLEGANPTLLNVYSLIRDVFLLCAGFYLWRNMRKSVSRISAF